MVSAAMATAEMRKMGRSSRGNAGLIEIGSRV
jgi:hypothetical protein